MLMPEHSDTIVLDKINAINDKVSLKCLIKQKQTYPIMIR